MFFWVAISVFVGLSPAVTMLFDYRAFWLAKDPRHADEYQDAYAVDPARGLASIADGVSASLFAGRWADVLARAAVDDPPDLSNAAHLDKWLDSCRAQWSRPIDADALPWHQRLKLHDGAFSTLLWIRLTETAAADSESTESGCKSFQLEAQAVGDSCLLHVRENRSCCAFPIGSSQQFGTDPPALGSANRHQDQRPLFESLSLDCRSGDLLILATDAIAAWALARGEAGDEPDWEACWRMSESAWRKWIVRLREDQAMRYDDATLVILRLAARGSAPSKRARRRASTPR